MATRTEPRVEQREALGRIPVVVAILLLALGLLAPSAQAQGIKLKGNAVILYGSASGCSQPATVNFNKVRNATPEWKTIRKDGVKKGSARYDLLMQRLTARVKKAAKSAAVAEGRDCVVRKGDIKDKKGLDVVDLTSQLISNL